MPFKYGPPVALLRVPLAWLPRHIGSLGWLVLSALALRRGRLIANCSPLGTWVADHSFSLVWGARSVPCTASAELAFDGHEVHRTR